VNVVANIGAGQSSFLAAMGMPAANAIPTVPGFDNVISMLLSSPGSNLAGAAATRTLTTPSQIADAMIRSMLGNPVTATSTTSLYADMPAALLNQTATNAMPPAPPKESRSITDLPTLTVMVTTPVVVPFTPGPDAANTPDTQESLLKENGARLAAPPESPMALLKNLPDVKVAFTAVLTPINSLATPVGVAGPAVPAEPMVTASGSLARATTENSPTVPCLASSIAMQSSGEQAGGEAASQQGDDPQQGPAQPIVIAANSRIKSPTPKQDDPPSISAREASAVAVPMSIAPSSEQSPATAATTIIRDAENAAPFHAAADALRTSESNMPAAPQLRIGIAQEISIRITPPDSPAVDLRVVERAGQVHVDVRTSDPAMQTSLRQDLGTLTNSLQRAGYHAETFTPSSAGRAAASEPTTNQDRQDSSQNRNGSGEFNDSRRQQQQKRSGTWLEELEEQS